MERGGDLDQGAGWEGGALDVEGTVGSGSGLVQDRAAGAATDEAHDGWGNCRAVMGVADEALIAAIRSKCLEHVDARS